MPPPQAIDELSGCCAPRSNRSSHNAHACYSPRVRHGDVRLTGSTADERPSVPESRSLGDTSAIDRDPAAIPFSIIASRHIESPWYSICPLHAVEFTPGVGEGHSAAFAVTSTEVIIGNGRSAPLFARFDVYSIRHRGRLLRRCEMVNSATTSEPNCRAGRRRTLSELHKTGNGRRDPDSVPARNPPSPIPLRSRAFEPRPLGPEPSGRTPTKPRRFREKPDDRYESQSAKAECHTRPKRMWH